MHCVVIGFDKEKSPAPRLFDYSDLREAPTETPARVINGYLVDGPNVLVGARSKQLSTQLPDVVYGSLPADGGNLIITPEQYDEVMTDPHMAKYVRPYVGAKELIHGSKRWCLWLVDLDPSDVSKSPALRARLEGVRRMREASNLDSTRQMAAMPHLFYFNGHPGQSYLCIPAHVSENRSHYLAQRFDADVISSNANSTAVDPDGFAFALISSSMFITWQRTVGGRLESRLRFSKKLVWNTLPLPSVDDATRQKIIEAGRSVLEARELHPDRSLADHYNSLAMDPQLVKAHGKLDAVVDRAFGAKRTCASEKERQEILFARYAELSSGKS